MLCVLAGPGWALELVGPRLGAWSDFGQTSRPEVLARAAALPVDLFRDEVFWDGVETDRGRFVFDNPRTTYPDQLGAGLLFLVNNPHRNHDGGTTPHTDAGVQAFARYAAEVLRRFPGIGMVEVGNEMNSATFAWGPGWEGAIEERAASYVRLLAATSLAVRAERPGVTVLGGAAHSVPIAWFREVFRLGAAAHMDAVVIHPYDVQPEQVARQIALLRREVPEVADMPVAVTEFGLADAATAPAYLMKSYCQQAIAGVNLAIWYPLYPAGDGLAALMTDEGLTPVGETFRFIRANLEGKAAQDVAPDPFTYGCLFDGKWMVLWGEAREIALAPGVRVVAGDGGQLSPDVPVVLWGAAGLRLGHEVRLGAQAVLAESWHQFSYAGGDPFQRVLRQGGRDIPLTLRPGQEREGVPWVPYLASDVDGFARVAAEWVQPSDPPDGPISVVYRIRASQAARVEVRVVPWDGGVTVTVRRNGQALADGLVKTGDLVEVEIGPRATEGGADLRVTLRKAD